MYYIEVGEFDVVYEFFDLMLELDFSNEYVVCNCVIVFYYGECL